MHVGIVAQRGNDRAADLASRLCETLKAEDVDVWVDESTAEQIDAPGVDVDRMTECNLVVSIGGDGTFLFAARGAGSTPILGVNLGEVGFLNAVRPDEAVEEVRSEVATYRETGAIPSRDAPRLVASGDGDWSTHPALNEISVQGAQRGHGQGGEFEIRVGDTTYDVGHADGVLVSTPTGSTAYNLSEGGPLVNPDVDGLVINQMCATDPMPPLVVDLDEDIEIHVSETPYAVVSSDATRRQVTVPETVDVSLTPEPARIAGPSADFYKALEKLD
ncbi:NAD(+) kinase [halophilic archaeon]|nr:NAD(+) kinase [halophilic archaeon]